jgi:UDP-N-acetylmuramoyl-L-alanyl-D-glutamate--2,6-diaminopimelate ligase
MGRIAAQRADALIVTDDNPRDEDPARITDAILQGLQAAGGAARARVIHDRALAIGSAIADATAEDVVLVAGKGHEAYQLIGGERRAFSDTAVARAALRAWGQL